MDTGMTGGVSRLSACVNAFEKQKCKQALRQQKAGLNTNKQDCCMAKLDLQDKCLEIP